MNKNQLSTEDYEICSKLKSMRFSGMAEALEEVFADPNAELLSFREKIQRIVDAEWNLRYSKKLNRFIKKATLKYPAADLDETIYNPERQLDVHIIWNLLTSNNKRITHRWCEPLTPLTRERGSVYPKCAPKIICFMKNYSYPLHLFRIKCSFDTLFE